MTNIECRNADCKYYDQETNGCGKKEIYINSDLVCDDFEFREFPDVNVPEVQ